MQHSDCSYHRCMIDGKVVKRGNLKSSHHKEIFFSFFPSFFFLLYQYEVIDVS